MKTVAIVAALSAWTAACSGGDSEASQTTEPAVAETSAPDDGAAPAEIAAATDDPLATKDGVDYANLTGDAAKGKMAFAQCRTCHVTDPGVNRIGPSLAGIVGRKAGSVKGFKYSPANANSGLTWTEEQLNVHLEDPQRVIPKTKMIFGGMADAQKRADLIAYLKNPS